MFYRMESKILIRIGNGVFEDNGAGTLQID